MNRVNRKKLLTINKKKIMEKEFVMVRATGELIADKIRSMIINAHDLFSIKEPSSARVLSILIVAIVDVIQDIAEAHDVSLTKEMSKFTEALEYAAKVKEENDKKEAEEKEENSAKAKKRKDDKEDGKE